MTKQYITRFTVKVNGVDREKFYCYDEAKAAVKAMVSSNEGRITIAHDCYWSDSDEENDK